MGFKQFENLIILLLLIVVSSAMAELAIGRDVPGGGIGGVLVGHINNRGDDTSEPVRDSATTRSISDMCAKKGRYCEIICRNNPAEGGPLCNCDAYALRSNPSRASLYNCPGLI